MKSVRVNKKCLTDGHDWDWFGGPPDWVCSRPGCHVRGHMFWGVGIENIVTARVPVTDERALLA